VDSNALRSGDVEIRLQEISLAVRPALLGRSFSARNVYRLHVPNGPGHGVEFSLFSAAIFCVRGALELDGRLRRTHLHPCDPCHGLCKKRVSIGCLSQYCSGLVSRSGFFPPLAAGLIRSYMGPGTPGILFLSASVLPPFHQPSCLLRPNLPANEWCRTRHMSCSFEVQRWCVEPA